MKNKYIMLLGLSVALTACDVNNDLDPIVDQTVEVAATPGSADFSKYVSLGASFTAGFSDGALFKASQVHSFPNILAQKFAMTNGGEFTQPLMNDNIGGFAVGGAQVPNLLPRFYFNPVTSLPTRLSATSTTDLTQVLPGPFNNMGVPGAKSFHLLAANYGFANPYFGRMASTPSATVLQDALAQNPTFFTLSEIGGNDVLGYAMSGGTGEDRTGDTNLANYGNNDITDPNVFANTLSAMVNALTANGAQGAIATVPNITSLPFFTTVKYNQAELSAGQAAAANAGFGAYNAGIQSAFAYLVANTPMTQEMADAEIAKRTITFQEGANAFVILDETLTDLTGINAGLESMRQATAEDLVVLSASSLLGTLVNNDPTKIIGVTVPLDDQWVLIPSEIQNVETATAAYNASIKTIAASKGLALVELSTVLSQASSTGYPFDDYLMTNALVTGGLVSLDGIHLTSRGYALMAAEFLKAIDATYGSNFAEATNGLPAAGDYPTNYSPMMQ